MHTCHQGHLNLSEDRVKILFAPILALHIIIGHIDNSTFSETEIRKQLCHQGHKRVKRSRTPA